MSDDDQTQKNRAERIARYKEQRRKELTAQSHHQSDPSSSSQIIHRRHNNNNNNNNNKDVNSSSSEGGGLVLPRTTRTSRLRAAAAAQDSSPTQVKTIRSKEVSSSCNEPGTSRVDRDKSNKRKSNLNRSLNSEEVPSPSSDLDDSKARRRRHHHRRFFLPPDLITSSTDLNNSNNVTTTPPRKSELSQHMDNARKSLTPSYCEMGKVKPKRAVTASPRNSRGSISDLDTVQLRKNSLPRKSTSDNDSKTIAKKMEELNALTRETLAKVERLANQNKERLASPAKLTKKIQPLSSILKRTSHEDPLPEPQTPLPVSILKRKISQDDPNKPESTHTSPVTFSPSVVEPATTNRKQGILKKRRSLDESQVMRHRSCSPDVAAKNDARSILKNQRRSSLEDLTRNDSLQGILKRKTSRSEEDDQSLNSPQGILKRRSGASSAGSTSSRTTPHVSITTAVILAAAGGAEIVLEPETVRPILKKKGEDCLDEVPKPILKKKSSTDTDDGDEYRPRKTILKVSRDSFSEIDANVKQREERRLSFSSSMRQSHTIGSDFNISKTDDRELKKSRPLSVFDLVNSFENTDEVASTGAIPKRSSLVKKRHGDRYRTQPVTSNELEASLNFVNVAQLRPEEKLLKSPNVSVSSLDFNLALENDGQLSSFLSILHNTDKSEICGGKMSSDSAFQSLGDGLELDQEDNNKSVEMATTSVKATNKFEMQMKSLAEEAKKMRLGKGLQKLNRNATGDRASSSRFATQPVTFEEVQEAAKLNTEVDNDPAFMSLRERIKLFGTKINNNSIQPQKRDVPRRRINRFQTQPVTSIEVDSARFINYSSLERNDPDLVSIERRGILKPTSASPRILSPIIQRKSVLKKRDSFHSNGETSAADVTYDEGISCNDSASDSETIPLIDHSNKKKNGKTNSDTTSDGESSGGREVRSIFRNENKLKIKNQLESVLSKSKSFSKVGDDIASHTNQKNPSTIRRSQTQAEMPRTIAEIQAELQQNGETGWRKRNNKPNDDINLLKDKNRYNDELSEKSILAARKDELDAAAQQWKSRVEKSDAEKFSVAGRMEKQEENSLAILIPNEKAKPQAKRFKGKEERDTSSTPVSPNKSYHEVLSRSYSTPNSDQDSAASSLRASGRKVSIARPDDYTFTNFYKSMTTSTILTNNNNENDFDLITLADFDAITPHSLLVQKKNVQVQKRRNIPSKNPIKALASRGDISNEYTEIITGVAERERKRLNIEKLAKGSHLAMEAIAALTTKEDFTSVALKKSTFTSDMAPFKPNMLLHIKGRRNIQTRLIEPTVANLNDGDVYILVTSTVLYNYIGTFSNVIEQARCSDILNHIQRTNDLGTKSPEIVTICLGSDFDGKKSKFWSVLGGGDEVVVTSAGHADEDEVYEKNVVATNMIYKLENKELVPYEEYWGNLPKIEMLEETKVLIFDFGTEMYVWSGKNAPIAQKRTGLKLAKELWDEGYNYTTCNISPFSISSILGNQAHKQHENPKLAENKRPDWALFAKITQHRETILFKEKFADWPDYTRVIRVRTSSSERTVDASFNIKPCNVAAMLAPNPSEPDLIVEGHHLGRGREFYDSETKRLFQFDTLDVTIWRILDNNSEKLPASAIGHFYDSDSYIVRWSYKMTVRGRELGGKPSKHVQAGRDRSVFFCWQGTHASINEKGYAALLTVELDSENAPQVRVAQGYEPPAFLRLFDNKMVVHMGKIDDFRDGKNRLFMIRGEKDGECYLHEVGCELKQLRSRTSFLLIDADRNKGLLWHGGKSERANRRNIRRMCEAVMSFDDDLVEIREGEETREFFRIMGRDRNEYVSLVDDERKWEFSMRLFLLSSVSSVFEAVEILAPCRSDVASPFPFLQEDLYAANQPALFLIDNDEELWLWQGWWPKHEEESIELDTQSGAKAIRWQAERRAAMQTALEYYQEKKNSRTEIENEQKVTKKTPLPVYLVWAGFEPLAFRNLFPTWTMRSDVAELMLKDGKSPNIDELNVEKVLAQLSRTIYPLDELLRKPYPEGVDPTHLETYLGEEDFFDLLEVSKEEFRKLPVWKQTALKKEKGLF